MRIWDAMDGSFVYGPFPAFHVGGFLLQVVMPTLARYSASVAAPALSSSGEDADLAISIIKMKNVKMMCAAPRLVEHMAKTEQGMEVLAGLEYLTFGGAPLPQQLGDQLSARGVKLYPIYGTTECDWLPTLTPDAEEWAWLRFHPDQKISWEDAGNGDGTYELCFKVDVIEHNELRATHWTLRTDVWRSKDLFIQHPSKPELWKYTGRKDDLLVLAHGYKINPIPLENIVASHPLVSGALMAGENRAQPCIFIEPVETVTDSEAFNADVRPTIEKANGLVREDSRIADSHVIIAEPSSFQRSAKGGIVRPRTVHKFANIMEELSSRR